MQKWLKVQTKLPDVGERVLVWVKFSGEDDFTWIDSYRESDNSKWFKEPVSGVSWSMGSARDYIITHWCYVYSPE